MDKLQEQINEINNQITKLSERSNQVTFLDPISQNIITEHVNNMNISDFDPLNTTDITPTTDSTYAIGTTSKRYSNVWTDLLNNTRIGNINIYVGHVNSDGSGASLPTDWSSTRNSTGNYTITHNLGTASYVMFITCTDITNSVSRSGAIYSKSTNSIQLITSESYPTNIDWVDSAFDFMIVMI